MKRMRIAMLGLAAVFAMSLVWSASAFAKSTNNPQYEIEEGGVAKILAAPAEKPETRVVEAEQSGVQKLEGSGVVLACKKLKLKAGATIIGSNKPNAGKSAETLEYSECEVEGSPNCEINKEKAGKAKLTTNALTDTLVFATKKAAEEEVAPTDTLFEPTTGKEFIIRTLGDVPDYRQSKSRRKRGCRKPRRRQTQRNARNQGSQTGN